MKKFFYFLAVLLCTVACQKHDDTQTEQDIPIFEENEPTEDLMEVTTTRKAVLYGNETEGFGASLIRRFRNIGGAYDESTKVCIVANSAIVSGALTQKDYLDIYNCYKKGGVVFVTSPTHQGFNKIFQLKLAEAVNSQYVKDFNMKVNDHAPVSNGTDTFLSQIQIPEEGGQAWDGLGFSIKGILYCEDLGADKQKGEEAATPYQIGLRADVAVRWMERSLLAYSSQLGDVIEKATTTVTYMHSMFKLSPVSSSDFRAGNVFCQTSETKNAFIEDITYVVAHDTQAHTDFYLITQDAEFRNNMISPVPQPENNTWWWSKDINMKGTEHWYPFRYVYSFYNWKSTLSVSMSNGKSVRIKNSRPEAENATTITTTTTTDTMDSPSGSLSFGGSIGETITGLMDDITSMFGHYWGAGPTQSVSVGTSRSKKDITILKSASDNKVTWTYTGKPLNWYKNGGNYVCWDMGDLQFSSMTQTNCLLAEVKNVTEGAATLTIDNEVTVRSGFFNSETMTPDKHNLAIEDCTTTYSTKVQLPTPYRYVQTWMFNCVSYGDMQSSTDKTNLWNDVEKNMLKGSSKFEVGDFKANGTVVAEAVVNLMLQDFKTRADHYKATYNASGTFKFEFRRSDAPGQVITAEYTIK